MRARVVLALLSLVVAWGAPSASAAGAGTAVVQCTADFPHVPAVNWTSGGTCIGTATVVAESTSFSIQGTGAFRADFDFNEPCYANGQPAIVLSFAVGTFTISGVPANGGSTTATIRGDFEWHRVGLNPAIVISNLSVALASGGGAMWSGPAGAGTATFVPPGNFNPGTQLLCGSGGGQLTIPVVIAAEVVV